MAQLPKTLLSLIQHLKKLPGVGYKSAERFAFTLLDWNQEELNLFSEVLSSLKEKVRSCFTCGCLEGESGCKFCSDPIREQSQTLCIVSGPKDVYAIEQTGCFNGLYHVLGGLFSPIEGRMIDPSILEKLQKRLLDGNVQEVIIALDSTIEGDATALLIKEKIQLLGKRATRLAFGLPMGSSLDFVDYGTLEKALLGRQNF